ncbi:hypothetical protein H6F32_01895 [Anabaena sp. FACHB-1237]|uniref:hypothetical protein n=1 Tax=Anabaena sp. FACHB-1237 TaxID=2692769 RepID=UPI0016800C9B|nr:hypothetical protein [Anabaena sp. FACHB-1237]MBD2136362.1 hypothetical protein [Anabaena sp. FACHB-1237]
MNFAEYQTEALNTDQIPAVEGSELIIPYLTHIPHPQLSQIKKAIEVVHNN